MQGMERAYDFQELVGCANTVNHLAAIEYGLMDCNLVERITSRKTCGRTCIL